MKKKIKVITVIDPATKTDECAYVQAAVGGDGKINILRTGFMPFIPEQTPAPAAEVYEKLKKAIFNNEVRFPSSPESGWINTSHYLPDPNIGYVGRFSRKSVYRPPSTHKRVFKKGRRIKTIAALDKHLSSGGWIFWGHQKRAVHPGWVMSWQYTMVRNSLGRMWKAVRI